jgi:GGDEF domain-containing protein
VARRLKEGPTLEKFGISVSGGGAEFDPEAMATVNDALRAADADMYRAKAERHHDRMAAG